MESEFFTDSVDLSEKNGSLTFFTFTNKIMAYVYKLIFGATLPRLTKKCENHFMGKKKKTENWRKDYIK